MLYLLLILLATLAYFYAKRRFNYWKDRGVPTLSPNFLLGDITQPIFARKNLAVTVSEAYDDFKKKGLGYGGLYFLGRPIFMPMDPTLLKNILVKDFEYFIDRGTYCDPKNDPLSGHIFNLSGDEWKIIRQKLTPAYTSGKLKGMINILEQHSDKLCEVINKCCNKDQEFITLFERYGIDIIGHVAFGVDCNSLESENSKFYSMTKKIFNPALSSILNVMITEGVTNPGSLIKLLTSDKQMCNYFTELVEDTVQYRKKNNVKVNDFLQLLIDLQDNQTGLTVEQIASQSYLFFIAAFETSSKALNFTMFELAKNKDLQDTLRAEVNTLVEENGGKYNYEMIMQNKLLDMIFKESLRKYPPVLYLNRECTKNYPIPGSTSFLEKGTILLIPILALQRDPDYFPDPTVFDPYRFSENNADGIKPYTYLPFGEGPRNCIGNRFGMMQNKLTIAKLVQNFEFSISKDTPDEVEINPVTENLLFSLKREILYNVKKV